MKVMKFLKKLFMILSFEHEGYMYVCIGVYGGGRKRKKRVGATSTLMGFRFSPSETMDKWINPLSVLMTF